MAKQSGKRKVTPTVGVVAKRTYLKQSEVPAASLEEALRIPRAILDNYAGKPTAPLHVAKALGLDPKGSQFRVLSGAAIAFGLIEGGAQAALISVTDLSRRILRPVEEGTDLNAMRESVLRPRVIGDFLRRYDGHPFPRQDIALNVLEDMGVPRKNAHEIFARITNSARHVGFLEEINKKTYVSLQGSGTASTPPGGNDDVEAEEEKAETVGRESETTAVGNTPAIFRSIGSMGRAGISEMTTAGRIADDERRRRVFITHGKSLDLVDPIKKLLEYGELVPVVSVEKQSVSKPVPEKVMDDMRGCGAAIIHVDADRTITDTNGQEHMLLNPNVLIEIGAAMAFYGRRFILLIRDGVKVPSNLQGLYEVRYKGGTLDASVTIKLLEAIKDIKNHSLPTDPIVS